MDYTRPERQETREEIIIRLKREKENLETRLNGDWNPEYTQEYRQGRHIHEYTGTDDDAKEYARKLLASTIKQLAELEAKKFDEMNLEQRSPVSAETPLPPAGQPVSAETPLPPADQTLKPATFESVLTSALLETKTQSVSYDEKKFNELYKTLVENNDKMKVEVPGKLYGTNKVPIINKPTDLLGKTALYNLFLIIQNTALPVSADANAIKAALIIQQTMVATFFNTINELKLKNNGTLTASIVNGTQLGKFIERLYNAEKPEGLLDAAGRLIPFVSTLRDYYTGKHTVSFDSKAAGEEALKKQRKDIDIGIDNEFAIMSAFIGTKSQKVSTKTALLAGAATGLWALVSKIQQNPELSSMIMASVAGIAGPQAAITGAVIIGAALSYFIYLKIQDKYAKYYILIRTMNEYMIVLNKIDRLVRLSVRISGRYNFDVNLKEIEAQLKVLFKRFDKMLSEDDVSQLEKKMYNATTVPDFGAAAAEAEAKAEDAADKAMSTEKADAGGTANDPTKDTTKDITTKPQGGGGLGDFIFKFTFDVEMWNQKLNDDVMKLNLYFTTAMTEFSMILNVIQMGLLTSDTSGDKTMLKTTNEVIKHSTEYRKMVIGILLNDILKLKVDYSYCNRGGGPGGMTKTTDEGVCMDIENMGVDAVGNRRSRFKEKLHGLMEHLVEVLNSDNCPYPDEIKRRIKKAVVEPYKQMINKANPATGPKNPFYLTNDAIIDPQIIASSKEKAISKLTIKAQDPPVTSGGAGWFGKSKDIKPSEQRDKEILDELKDRAYDFVSHQELTEFLIAVDKFVKAENEPSPNEKKEAKEIANAVADSVNNAVQSQPDQTGAQTEARAQTEAQAQTAKVGGRRLTRKKRRANKKKVRQTKAVKKSHNYNAKAAMKGKLLKKMI
jgi:hypothetical protein